MITHPKTGIRMMVKHTSAAPLLTILLPEQPLTSRGIEVEFPEHITGRHQATHQVEHLYLAAQQVIPIDSWQQQTHALTYEILLQNTVHLRARAELEADGIRFSYEFTNRAGPPYEHFQAVTCVKLYDVFEDTFLERTYVHHTEGFDLLASETPQRHTMTTAEWLPCRYLVPFRWPVVPETKRVEEEDGVIRYHKSRQVDEPFIATLSVDQHWLAATYTVETGNVWTNPERTCQHADPATELLPGDMKRVELKTFLLQGTLDQLLEHVKEERQRLAK
jgi:hypothetical protein